jgi:hypothetical protein
VQISFRKFAEKVTTKSKYKEKRSKVQETSHLLFPFVWLLYVEWDVHTQSRTIYLVGNFL